jgi:branched-chain amino acid transport system permease protein
MDPRARAAVRRAITVGGIVGVATIYLSMVGLIGAFAARPVVAGVGAEGPGYMTLGLLMLAAVPFLAGMYVSGAVQSSLGGSPLLAVACAALTGLVGGLVLGAFMLIANTVDLGDIFISVNPALVEILSFGQDPLVGVVMLAVGGGIVGALAGGIQLLDRRDRGAVMTAIGIVLLLSLLEPIIDPVLAEVELDAVRGFLFEGGGLSLAAAALVLALVLGLSWAWRRPAAPLRERVAALPAEQRRRIGFVLAGLGVLGILILPQISTGFVSQVLVYVGFNLMLALGLNIVVGYAGLLDLGYVAFYAVGAYTMGVLISPSSSMDGPISAAVGQEWGFWVALPLVLLVTALVGILIGAPVLRLRGDYLAIVTLGFGEIARILFGSDALRDWVGGPNGVVGLPNLHIPFVGEISGPKEYFYPVVAFAAFAAFVAWRLSNSRTGRAWNALREDESVAEATGVNTTNYKLLAFALGGTLGGLSGALFAVQLTTVFPGAFVLIVSITVLAIIILGGMGTIRGVIVGALVLVGLPEALREFGEYRFLVYGAALVAMMILRPEGLFPSRTRRAELHEDVEIDSRPQLPATGEAT